MSLKGKAAITGFAEMPPPKGRAAEKRHWGLSGKWRGMRLPTRV